MEQPLRVVVPQVLQLGLDVHVRERGSGLGIGQGGDLGESVAGGECGTQREAAMSCRELRHRTQQADGEGAVPHAGEAPRVVVEQAPCRRGGRGHLARPTARWRHHRHASNARGRASPRGRTPRRADRPSMSARAEVGPLSGPSEGGARARLSIERVGRDPRGQSQGGFVAVNVGHLVEGGARCTDFEVEPGCQSVSKTRARRRRPRVAFVADGGVVAPRPVRRWRRPDSSRSWALRSRTGGRGDRWLRRSPILLRASR